MVEAAFREAGSFAVGGRREEPVPPRFGNPVPAPADPSVIVTPPPSKTFPLFGGDQAAAPDALGLDPVLGCLAEVALHARTTTPIAIGLLGGPGSGKTFALRRTLAMIGDLAAAAARQGNSPFHSRVHVEVIDAATLDGDIASGLAASLHAGLRPAYPDLAREIGQTARDPLVVLREVEDKLDDARRRLDAERRALDDAGSRRARLAESVLYEAAGSQVDAYARANKAGIAGRLAAFGIGGEPIRSYKEMVQYAAGSGGTPGLILRSPWAYKGQTKLIVAAILFALAGIGIGIAINTQDIWLADLRAGAKAGTAVADWLDAHIGLLATLRMGAFLVAALAILFNLWRAFAFVSPILKGARLLDSDLETRRRDLDGLYAHQTKRVDTLADDVERLTREVGEAEKRAGGLGQASRHQPSPFAASAAVQAQGVFAGLSHATANSADKTAPQRIVLALDHLDALPAERARAILDAVHRTAGRGIVVLAAADTARLDLDTRDRGALTRWIDVPLRLDAAADGRDTTALVARALGRTPAAAPAKADAATSALDTPVGDDEAALLTLLAPIAGASPRAVKRFVALYALARLSDGIHRGALAFMLAVALGGSSAEKDAVSAALANLDPSAAFGLPTPDDPRLTTGLAGAQQAAGTFTAGDALAAKRAAARFTLAD